MSNIFRIYFELNPPRDKVIDHNNRLNADLAMSSDDDDLPDLELYYERGTRIFYRQDKRQWLIVHPTANLQRERNTFRAAQLWKIIRVSDLLTLIGTFYSSGITVDRPVEE